MEKEVLKAQWTLKERQPIKLRSIMMEINKIQSVYSTSSNEWDASFSDDSITIDAFSSQVVTLTIEAEKGR